MRYHMQCETVKCLSLDNFNKHKQLVHHCGWSARQLCNIAYNPDVKVLDHGNIDLVYASLVSLCCIILFTGVQSIATIASWHAGIIPSSVPIGG